MKVPLSLYSQHQWCRVKVKIQWGNKEDEVVAKQFEEWGEVSELFIDDVRVEYDGGGSQGGERGTEEEDKDIWGVVNTETRSSWNRSDPEVKKQFGDSSRNEKKIIEPITK